MNGSGNRPAVLEPHGGDFLIAPSRTRPVNTPVGFYRQATTG